MVILPGPSTVPHGTAVTGAGQSVALAPKDLASNWLLTYRARATDCRCFARFGPSTFRNRVTVLSSLNSFFSSFVIVSQGKIRSWRWPTTARSASRRKSRLDLSAQRTHVSVIFLGRYETSQPAAAAMAGMSSVVGTIFGHADRTKKPCLTWIKERGQLGRQLSYQDLRETSLKVAHKLRVKYGLAEGDRVILMYAPGVEFIEAFFGCLSASHLSHPSARLTQSPAAGVIAVPVFPPMPKSMRQDLIRLSKIVARCSPKLILASKDIKTLATSEKVKQGFQSLLPNQRPVKWPDLPTKSVALGKVTQRFQAPSGPKTVAFIQFSSGSTGDPKVLAFRFEQGLLEAADRGTCRA